MTITAAATVYKAMTLPVTMYCSLVNPLPTMTGRQQLEKFDEGKALKFRCIKNDVGENLFEIIDGEHVIIKCQSNCLKLDSNLQKWLLFPWR